MRVWLISVMMGVVYCVGMANNLVYGKGTNDVELAELFMNC